MYNYNHEEQEKEVRKMHRFCGVTFLLFFCMCICLGLYFTSCKSTVIKVDGEGVETDSHTAFDAKIRDLQSRME